MTTTHGASHRYVVNRHDAGKSGASEIRETIHDLIQDFGAQAVHDEFIQSPAGALVKANTQQVVQVINFVLSKVIDAENPRLAADTMGIGTGYHLRLGMSIRDLAKKYGRTPAAISKSAIEFTEEMGLPPSQLMRPIEHRSLYAKTNQVRV